jgi:hypothetical protein
LQLNECKPGSLLHAILLYKVVLSQPDPPKTDVERVAALLTVVRQTPTFGPLREDKNAASLLVNLKRVLDKVRRAGSCRGKYKQKSELLSRPWGGCHPVGFIRPYAGGYAQPAGGYAQPVQDQDTAAPMEVAETSPAFWHRNVDLCFLTPWVNTAAHILSQLEIQLVRSEQGAAECVSDEPRPSLSPEVWDQIKGFIPVGGWGATLPLGKRLRHEPALFSVSSVPHTFHFQQRGFTL